MRQLDQVYDQLPIISFEKRQALHDWLLANEQTSPGIWIRIFKAKSKSPSVTFHEVLEEGLCFGWSESMRRSYDDLSYLQKFTPRKGKSTQSERNLRLVDKLAAATFGLLGPRFKAQKLDLLCLKGASHMAKDLTQLSLEELWHLFPIFLVAPKAQWETNYQEMAVRLEQVLGDLPLVRISHIGSTAIPGIWAKDIVDVLVELAPQSDLRLASDRLVQSGFLKMSESEGRISLNSGYTPQGFADKVYHIHLRYQGDHDELYFRDYLREHAQVAKDYEALKLALWHQYEHNRDAYTDAKTDFIQIWTRQARQEYGGRYDKGKTD